MLSAPSEKYFTRCYVPTAADVQYLIAKLFLDWIALIKP